MTRFNPNQFFYSQRVTFTLLCSNQKSEEFCCFGIFSFNFFILKGLLLHYYVLIRNQKNFVVLESSHSIFLFSKVYFYLFYLKGVYFYLKGVYFYLKGVYFYLKGLLLPKWIQLCYDLIIRNQKNIF